MSSSAGTEYSNAELLWAFDRELARGGEPEWDTFLAQCPDDASRAGICADMIRCEANLRGWNPEAVRNRLELYGQLDPSESGRAAVLRGIYTDRLEAGDHPSWREFEPFGHRFDLLRLRTDHEPVCLGQVLGERYRIEQRLGIGSLGVVYRGTDMVEHRNVALKTIRISDSDTDKMAATALEQEAEMLMRHPTKGIPQSIDLFNDFDGRPVVVREFIDGRTIHELIQEGPMSPERAAKIIAQLAETLQVVHRHDCLHRDLSAGNVLIDGSDVAFLMDFGRGILQSELFDQDRGAAGTWGYMSVESAIGATREIDARDDIFSLGVILYELLTGRSALDRRSRSTAIESVRKLGEELSRRDSDIPPELLSICRRCVADDADDRYDIAALVGRELRRILGETVPSFDETQVVLAKRRLLVWRAGISWGKAYACCAYVRSRMDKLLTDAGQDLKDAAVPLQLMFSSEKGLLDEFLKVSAFGGTLGAEVPKLPFIPEFVHVYNNARNQPDPAVFKFLSSFNNGMSGILDQTRAQLQSQAEADGGATSALLKVAIAAGSQAIGEHLPEGLATATVTAGLSRESTAGYIAFISCDPSRDDHEREVERLRKSVERELMNQLADAMDNRGELQT